MGVDEKVWPPPYRVRRSKRSRRVSLRVSDTDGLELVLPQNGQVLDVPSLLERHRPWIMRHLGRRAARIEAGCDLHGASPLEPPAGFWLHGGELRVDLDIRPSVKAALVRAAIAKTPVLGTIIWPLAEAVGDNDATIRRRLSAHVKTYARLYLAACLKSVSVGCGLAASGLCFGTQKSRWGSYAPDGIMRLNHKLVFLPVTLAEHVILHELCHSVYPGHGQDFWRLILKLDPDARKKNRDLRSNRIWIPSWFI